MIHTCKKNGVARGNRRDRENKIKRKGIESVCKDKLEQNLKQNDEGGTTLETIEFEQAKERTESNRKGLG